MAKSLRLVMADNAQNMWTIGLNGSGRFNLPALGHTPSWTPDGKIIYATPSGNEIRVMDAAGNPVGSVGNLTQLSGIIKPHLVGNVILFTTARPDFAGDVWAMQQDGSNLRKLTSGTAAFLSPNSTWCSFTRVTPSPIHCNVWRINIDGTGEQQLTSWNSATNRDANASAISLNGQTIAMFWGPEEAGLPPDQWGQRDVAEMLALGGTPKVIVAATPAVQPGFPQNYPPLPALLSVDSPAPYRDTAGQHWWVFDGGRPDGEGTYKVKYGGGPITKLSSSIRGSGNVPVMLV